MSERGGGSRRRKERKGEREGRKREGASDCIKLRQANWRKDAGTARAGSPGRAVQGALLPRLQKDGRSDFREEAGQVLRT